ncbi:MAG: hypothetical protein PHY72_04315 [Candidatus Pacebacteria bacterium]|nr:hypothetical protein [Candidatus Paceibacterota bacterium]
MDKAISFDLHDTILVFRIKGQIKQNKILRAILYFLSNFKSFVFVYTYFCQRNESIIELMKASKIEGNKVIILTSTNQRCAKIISYFLKKNNIGNFDEIFFRRSFWQKESDYKIEEIQRNNIHLHYDDGIEVCAQINKYKGNSCVVV